MCKSPLRMALLLTALFALIVGALWLFFGDELRGALSALLKLVVIR